MCYIKSASLHFNFRLCCTFFFSLRISVFLPSVPLIFSYSIFWKQWKRDYSSNDLAASNMSQKKKKIRWGLLSSTRHIKTSYHRSKTSHGFFKMERGGLFTKLLLDSTWLQVQILELFNTKGIWSSLKNLDSAENT